MRYFKSRINVRYIITKHTSTATNNTQTTIQNANNKTYHSNEISEFYFPHECLIIYIRMFSDARLFLLYHYIVGSYTFHQSVRMPLLHCSAFSDYRFCFVVCLFGWLVLSLSRFVCDCANSDTVFDSIFIFYIMSITILELSNDNRARNEQLHL